MPISLRPCRLIPLACLIGLAAAACGGGSGSGSPDAAPSQGAYADVQGWLDLRTNRVALTWADVVQDATRYQIEQEDANGAWVAIDAVWAVHGQVPTGLPYSSPNWQGTINPPTTLRVEAVTPSSRVPLQTLASIYSRTETSLTFAPPASPPSIELDQPEPLEQATHVTLANVSTSLWGAISVDVLPFASLLGGQPALTLDPGTFTSGTHVIYAIFAAPGSGAAYVVSRSVQTHNSKPALAPVELVQNVNEFDDYLLATADAGIASLVASLNDVPIEMVTAPNACVPPPCAAGQPFNGYHLSVNTQSLPVGSHVLGVEATDNAGNTTSYPAHFNLPAPAGAVLDAPVDGAVVAGTLHLSGTFSSGAPGPLEVMVTLSGVPAYDKTVANKGVTTPFAADVSLAGMTPGYHTLGVYTRVGNTAYTTAATILVQVATAP